MNFGEVLQKKRKSEGLTQEELANKLFVSSKTISNWETNKTTPDIDNVIRISNLLGISLNNLLLEGSDVVENIKKKAELRESRIYLATTSLTNLIFLFIIGVSPIYGDLPLLIVIALVIGVFSNLLSVLYFSKRYTALSGNTWAKASKTRKVWTVIAGIVLGIVVLGIIYYIRFKYNAF